jgi:hypothetical protein
MSAASYDVFIALIIFLSVESIKAREMGDKV